MTIELTDAEKTDRIRSLNDTARQNPGVACRANMTIGFAALQDHDRHRAVRQIMVFDQFDEGNDPHGEHDFGAIYRLVSGEWVHHRPQDEKLIAETVFWKIDCYDRELEFGSEAPWDSAQTTRVLTIMLASEY
jgi:hypothetical protein